MYKIIKRNDFKFGIIILTIIPIIFGLLMFKENSILVMSGKKYIGTYEFFVFVTSFMRLGFLLYIIIIVITSNVFSKELHDGTINLLIVRATSRKKIFLSKIFSSLTTIILYTVVIFLSSLFSYYIFVKNGPYGANYFFDETIISDIGFILVTILDMIFVFCLCMIISVFFNSIKTILITFVSLIIMKLLVNIDFLKKLIPISIGDATKFYNDVKNLNSLIVESIIVLLIYCIIISILSVISFNRKDMIS